MENKEENSKPVQEPSGSEVTNQPSAYDGDERSNSDSSNNPENNQQSSSPTKTAEATTSSQASKVDQQEDYSTERKRKRRSAGLMVSFAGRATEIPPKEYPPEEPEDEKPEDEQDEAYNPDEDNEDNEDNEDSEQGEEMDSAPLDLPQGLIANLLSQGTLGNKPLHAAAATGDLEELKELIKEGGEMHDKVNDVDIFYYTALHVASERGHADCCEVLIKSGLDIEARTKLHESTALHYGTFPFPKFCCS